MSTRGDVPKRQPIRKDKLKALQKVCQTNDDETWLLLAFQWYLRRPLGQSAVTATQSKL